MTYSDAELIQELRSFHDDTSSVREVDFGEWSDISKDTLKNRFDSWGNAVDEAGLEHDFDKCPYPKCKNYYPKLGKHWRYKTKHRPEITERQHEILTGLIMGDGYVNSFSGHPWVGCGMATSEFLKWVDDKMGALGTGVDLKITAEESARSARDSGFREEADEKDYKDIFVWQSRSHPQLIRYAKWYNGESQKKFPKELKLTPLILSVWFCCDGYVKDRNSIGPPSVAISSYNEIIKNDRGEFIKELFEDIGTSPTLSGKDICFGIEDSEFLWDWMEGPLPEFKYKWPSEEELRRTGYYWTDEEIGILKEEYPEKGYKIEKLERSMDSIHHKARELEITYKGT